MGLNVTGAARKDIGDGCETLGLLLYHCSGEMETAGPEMQAQGTDTTPCLSLTIEVAEETEARIVPSLNSNSSSASKCSTASNHSSEALRMTTVMLHFKAEGQRDIGRNHLLLVQLLPGKSMSIWT